MPVLHLLAALWANRTLDSQTSKQKDSHSKSELTSRYNKVSKFLGSSFQQSVHGIFLFFILNIRSSFADVAGIEKAFRATWGRMGSSKDSQYSSGSFSSIWCLCKYTSVSCSDVLFVQLTFRKWREFSSYLFLLWGTIIISGCCFIILIMDRWKLVPLKVAHPCSGDLFSQLACRGVL